VLFLIKGHLLIGRSSFAQRLAETLNSTMPAWSVDAAALREWEEMLRGWEEADTSIFRVHHIDVDHAVALVAFEHRREYPPPPPWSPTTPRHVFERWRDGCCLDVLNKRLDRVFRVVCDLVASVEHPVVTGSELGTTPQDSLLTRMLLFKHSRTPHLKILLRENSYGGRTAAGASPTATIYGRELPPEQVLGMIQRNPDGSVSLDPELLPSRQTQAM
jgi:hypothetical protein